jgi:hypothetical protein
MARRGSSWGNRTIGKIKHVSCSAQRARSASYGESDKPYTSIDKALADAEQAIVEWLDSN